MRCGGNHQRNGGNRRQLQRSLRETSVLATKEVGLVIIGSGSTSIVGNFELIIICKPVIAGAEDGRNGDRSTGELKLKPSRLHSWRGGRCRRRLVGHHQVINGQGLMLNDAAIKHVNPCIIQYDGSSCFLLRWPRDLEHSTLGFL